MSTSKTSRCNETDARDAVSSPKRGRSERRGTHAWHPYYAGFSEAFVKDVLSELELVSDGVVLDPMNGSGTTTLVSQNCGYLAVGTELNPVMAILARAKDAAFFGQQKLDEVASKIANRAQKREIDSDTDEYDGDWFSPTAFANLKRLETELAEIDECQQIPLDPRLAALVPEGNPPGGQIRDFLRAALLVTSRRVSNAIESKNPTWMKSDRSASESEHSVFDVFRNVSAEMVTDINAVFTEVPQARRLLVMEEDARKIPLEDDSVDAIVTSPPYLTRIDYAVGTTPELVFLGYKPNTELRNLRRELMGSTCVAGGSYEWNQLWGETCLDTLQQVKSHPSKASVTYYLKMHVQYFRDAEKILRECLRVLKPGSSAVFVVQDSWYKDVHISLEKIYIEMALELGADSAETIHSETVKSHLGLVNTRARRYKKGDLQEHVVLFRSK